MRGNVISENGGVTGVCIIVTGTSVDLAVPDLDVPGPAGFVVAAAVPVVADYTQFHKGCIFIKFYIITGFADIPGIKFMTGFGNRAAFGIVTACTFPYLRTFFQAGGINLR